MKIKEMTVKISRSTRIKDYSAVDIRVRVDGAEKELHELLPDNDFVSKFDQMLNLLREEVINMVKEYDE